MIAACSARRYCWSKVTARRTRRAARRTGDGSACSAAAGRAAELKAALAKLRLREDFDSLDMPALLNALIEDAAQIQVLYIHGHWTGVNDVDDLRQAVDFAHAQAPLGR
jgi:hypothetical protein